MITPLTREQVQKLTPEQQETIGSLEAQRIRMRQQLLERARCYRGRGLIEGLLIAVVCGLAMYGLASPRALPFAVMALIFLVWFHVAGLNRRLDALMQLLDHDISQDSSRRSGESEVSEQHTEHPPP